MPPVLDLDPVPEPAGAIEAVAMLRDQPFETHQAGVAEQVRADLALLEWRQMEPSTRRITGSPSMTSELFRLRNTASDEPIPTASGVAAAREQAHTLAVALND